MERSSKDLTTNPHPSSTLFDMTDRYIARTGRVQSWLDNPESKLPVSCTVFVVDDSMEGPDGIEASWRFVSHALRNAAGVAVHLSKLRPRGEENGKGLVASGPVSFARIYSVLNETLRRGGTYKNGACVIHLDANHADIEEFVDASRAELPWVKKCIDVTPEWWNDLTESLQAKILKAIQAGDIWLNKVKYNQRGERIYGNVCLEIYLPSRGTCLLQHLNLGQCHVEDLQPAFAEGMQQLVALHGTTGVGDTGEYLAPEVDRQVGLGLLGLANFLRIHGVSYAVFGEALAPSIRNDEGFTPALILAREFVAELQVLLGSPEPPTWKERSRQLQQHRALTDTKTSTDIQLLQRLPLLLVGTLTVIAVLLV